jgi:hypothetical protein
MSFFTNRRDMLKAFSAAGLTSLSSTLFSYAERGYAKVQAGETKAMVSGDYGPISPCKDETTGMELLKLPEGFTYHSFNWTGEMMDDGVAIPMNHDGMCVLSSDENETILCRNHEVDGSNKSLLPAVFSYDGYATGGCTNVVLDTKTMKPKRTFVSLSGTSRNCAGGRTPWGTWLTCEETTYENGSRFNGREMEFTKPHGYIFEVPADGTKAPVALKEMGRFWHEAIAIDPATGIVYETEDRDTAGLYRYIPKVPGKLAEGGKLQMLKVAGVPDLRKGMKMFQTFDVTWVDIDDVERAHVDGTTNSLGVYQQGKKQGASTFARLEGAFYSEGRIYITATNGGDAKMGQVWEYTPAQNQLKLIYESPGIKELNLPDNIAVSPRGGIILCEDGYKQPMRLRALNHEGVISPFAENCINLKTPPIVNGTKIDAEGNFAEEEFAGVCFTPDGKWMFVNNQVPGVTFAITGPWKGGLV